MFLEESSPSSLSNMITTLSEADGMTVHVCPLINRRCLALQELAFCVA